MSNICIVVLIGIPGAGKTTFCKELLKYNKIFNIIHVCFDDYIKPENKYLDSYKNKRTKLIGEVQTLINSIKSKLQVTSFFLKNSNIIDEKADYIIIIDDNNYYKGMRYIFYKICKCESISFLQIYIETTIIEALKRNKQRKLGYVPENIIKNICDKLEIPSLKSEWERGTLVINTKNTFMLDDILSSIFKLSVIPIPKIERATLNQTNLHNIDIILRKHIKYLIMSNKYEQNTKILAAKLNSRRKDILEDLRCGILNSNDDENTFIDILSYELQNNLC